MVLFNSDVNFFYCGHFYRNQFQTFSELNDDMHQSERTVRTTKDLYDIQRCRIVPKQWRDKVTVIPLVLSKQASKQ